MLKRWMVAMLVAVAGMLIPANVAHAEPTEPLTTQEEIEATGYDVLPLETTDYRVTSDGRHCFDGGVKVRVHNRADATLFDYIFRSSACWAWVSLYNREIVAMRWERPYVHVPWWSPWEMIDQTIEARRGGEGTDTAYRRWRAHMKACALHLPWCSNRYPYVALRFFSDGTYTRGGGLD